MTENEAKLLEKLDDLANDLEVDMYSVATLNAYFEECGNAIRGLLKEIQQYRTIGTLEEFKDLKKKNQPRELAEHNFQDEVHHYLCPSCRSIVSYNQNYCEECGQALKI